MQARFTLPLAVLVCCVLCAAPAKASTGPIQFIVAGEGPGGRFLVAPSPESNQLQARVEMNPCGTVAVHTHPRGAELAYVLHGSIVFGLSAEDGSISETNVKAGQSFLLPDGLIHYEANLTCKPAAFLATLTSIDPGTQFTLATASNLSQDILLPSYGVKKLPTFLGPFSLNKDCVKKCSSQLRTCLEPVLVTEMLRCQLSAPAAA